MAQRRTRGSIARAAVAAALTGVMALGGVVGPVGTALAGTTSVEVKIVESVDTAFVANHDVYQIFTADVDKTDAPANVASNVEWTSEEMRDVVCNALTRLPGTPYQEWLTNHNIAYGSDDAQKASNVAKFISEKIANDERSGDAIAVSDDAVLDIDGNKVKVTGSGSVANVIAAAIENSKIEPNAKEKDKFTATTTGFYLLVPTGSTDGSAAIYLPVSESDAASGLKVAIKKDKPTIDKEINDGAGELKVADKGVGDEVTFTIATTIPSGTTPSKIEKWNVVDTMPAGLSYKTSSAKVDGTEVADPTPANNVYTFDLASLAKTAASTQSGDNDTATTDTVTLTLTYTATVNSGATTGNDGLNANTATLDYTIDGTRTTIETVPSEAKVATYEIKLHKVNADGTEDLAGATFYVAYDADGDGDLDAAKDFYLKADGTRVAYADEPTDTEGLLQTTDANGAIEVKPVGSGKYVIIEQAAPDGYDKIAADVTLTLTGVFDQDSGEITAINGVVAGGNGDVTSESDIATGIVTVTIPNEKSEITLPVTGMTPSQLGTVLGALLVAGGAAMIVRRRQAEQA